MRVLIIQGTPTGHPLSGELTVIYNEQRELSKCHEIQVNIVYPSTVEKRSLIATAMNVLWSRKNYNLILDLIKKFKPDIVHFHSISPYLSISVLAAAKKSQVPVIQTLHNMRWLCVEGGFFRGENYCDECVKGFGLRGAIRGCAKGRAPSFLLFSANLIARYTGFLFRAVDKFIAVSDFVRDNHVIAGFPAEKIEVNNNGIDFHSFMDKGYAKPWRTRRGVAFAGRLSIAKGSAVLQYLITKIDQPIHIIGDGPELETLQLYCKDLQCSQVKFWGKLSHTETLEILGSVGCTIVPSQCGETFSLVAAESMALGTPVVAANIGGLGSLIRNSGGGILFEAKDFYGAVEAVNWVLGSPSEAEKIGEIGKRFVFEQLSLVNSTKKLEKIYERVVNHTKSISDQK